MPTEECQEKIFFPTNTFNTMEFILERTQKQIDELIKKNQECLHPLFVDEYLQLLKLKEASLKIINNIKKDF